MAFSFADSIAVVLLLAAAIAVWAGAARGSRQPLRFATILFAALAVASVCQTAWPAWTGIFPAVALMVVALGGVALALAMGACLTGPVPSAAASAALILGLAAGLGALVTGRPALALAVSLLAAAAILLAALAARERPRQAILAALAGLALAGGIFLLADDAADGALIFFAAALTAAGATARADQKWRSTSADGAATRA